MHMIAEKIYTRDEFSRLPDSDAYELVDGRLVERNVSESSSWVALNIARLLANEAHRVGGASVYGADLTYDCFAPSESLRRGDASVIRSDRMADLDDPGYMPIPADLIVEVISPNDNAYELDEKIEQYLRAGFKIIWIVFPESRAVVIYRADGSVVRLHENDEITGEVALPTFKCRVGEFFRK